MSVIPVESSEHWHQLRAAHVGSSDIACLFDASPYKTRWMLWQEKVARVGNFAPSERMSWGKRLEGAIAQGLAEDMSWKVASSAKVYHQSDRVPCMGATLDYEVVDHEWGPGIVEIKNVDYFEFRELWDDTRAPDHIELQVQHQLAVTGWPWAVISPLVGGNRLVIYERRPIARVIAEIERRCAEFWQSVEERREPEPFGDAAELELLKELFPREEQGKVIVVSDEKLDEAAAQYVLAQEQEAAGKRLRERQRVALLHAAGDAALLKLPSHYVKRTTTKTGAVVLKVTYTGPGITKGLSVLDAG